MPDDIWAVRGVSESLRKSVKHYAVDQGVPMGQVVERLIAEGLASEQRQLRMLEDYRKLDDAMIQGFSSTNLWGDWEAPGMIISTQTLYDQVKAYCAHYGIEQFEAIKRLLAVGIEQWQKELGISEPRMIPDKPE